MRAPAVRLICSQRLLARQPSCMVGLGFRLLRAALCDQLGFWSSPSTCTFAEVLNCSQGVRRVPNARVCSVGARVVRFSALDRGMLADHLHAVSLSKVPVRATAVGQVARVRVRVLSRTTRLPHPNTSATPPPTRDHFALSLRFAHQSLFSRHMIGQGQNTHLLVFKNKKIFFKWRENTHASDASLHTTNLKASTNSPVESSGHADLAAHATQTFVTSRQSSASSPVDPQICLFTTSENRTNCFS